MGPETPAPSQHFPVTGGLQNVAPPCNWKRGEVGVRVRGMLCFIGYFSLEIKRRDLVLSLGPWPEGKGHAVHVGSPL